mmetsp:Transcript_35183/g.45362  ORF Transcript_35183/g.45362 Transcript_35183/m.45362 type:complete len:537 (-) Transcript_35183:43-1653(-)|eukprot:CAMPEP_0114342720 /NCGR_PEP_ID=MMETSP0101-20121206/10022_1 /TAXON_ID=38822 ORGANISM="Pteridomonas danica, Strain PT" /NCGR_SAMPLE_ID=MMETSP0101 /ASSEMBLY_ACC=CAM_ASM_000211 /LENGTH=536 /DNA_ID=CAMNT_0001476991 /DNA_START=106 /DNA_END=1716 /DNA_ORIENTATION=-
MQPFPIRRRWNADIRLGIGGYDEYLKAVNQPGEAHDDLRMPNEMSDGSVKVKELEEIPDDANWWEAPLFPQPTRVQDHEFINEMRHPQTPFSVDMNAYMLAPINEEMKERLEHHENNFRKAGIPARHLRFLTDLYASERLPWERTQHGWYGHVSNREYQKVVVQREFDEYGAQWYIPQEARRKRSDFEIALATQLKTSEAEQKTFGLNDHYHLTEHEKQVGLRKKFRTPDEHVGFADRKYGPPGLAEPLLLSNSLSNHRFHSYNGAWSKGKMHGRGVYRFADDTEYIGGWLNGKRSGHGETTYKDGSKYVGQWLDGYYHGEGVFTYNNNITYTGGFQKGLRHGKGKMVWKNSNQEFEGEFYAGLRHGHGVHRSIQSGFAFEGEYFKGKIRGNGSLIVTDKKKGSTHRIRRGLWHKGEFAPGGEIRLKDIVSMIDKEDTKKTHEKAVDYLAIHGTVIAAQLNDWCFDVKKELRDARKAKKDAEDEERRQKQIEAKEAMAELRKQAREAKLKAADDSDFENDTDDDEDGEGDDDDDDD